MSHILELKAAQIIRTISTPWHLDLAMRSAILSRAGVIQLDNTTYSIEEEPSDGLLLHATRRGISLIDTFTFCPYSRETKMPKGFKLAGWSVPPARRGESEVQVCVIQKFHPSFSKYLKAHLKYFLQELSLVSLHRHFQIQELSFPQFANKTFTAGIIGYPIPGEPFDELILRNYLIKHGWKDTGSISFKQYRLFEFDDPDSFEEVVIPVTGAFEDLVEILQFAETLWGSEDTLVKGTVPPGDFQNLKLFL